MLQTGYANAKTPPCLVKTVTTSYYKAAGGGRDLYLTQLSRPPLSKSAPKLQSPAPIGLGQIRKVGMSCASIPKYAPNGSGRDLFRLKPSRVPNVYRDHPSPSHSFKSVCYMQDPLRTVEPEPLRDLAAKKRKMRRQHAVQSTSVQRLACPGGLDFKMWQELQRRSPPAAVKQAW
jgi:hypothetical protein